MLPAAPIALAFAIAAAGAWLYRRWAPRAALDIPGPRSSHTRPTLRGGGIVIVAGFYAGLLLWLQNGNLLSPRAIGWVVGALFVASVSFVDDLHPLPALPRLLAHTAAAILITLAGVQTQDPALLLSVALAFVYVIVLTNVYNFMDGIDGL